MTDRMWFASGRLRAILSFENTFFYTWLYYYYCPDFEQFPLRITSPIRIDDSINTSLVVLKEKLAESHLTNNTEYNLIRESCLKSARNQKYSF